MTDKIKEEPPESVFGAANLPSMFWAAAGAAAIPTALGFIGLFFCFFPTQLGLGMFQEFLIAVPISLCFALGPPLVAWLSCRQLIFKSHGASLNHFRLLGVGPVAMKYSFYVHGLAFLTHVILVSIFSGGNGADMFFLSLMFGGLINGVLFVIVTMPLSVFCAAIFALLYRVPATAPISSE